MFSFFWSDSDSSSSSAAAAASSSTTRRTGGSVERNLHRANRSEQSRREDKARRGMAIIADRMGSYPSWQKDEDLIDLFLRAINLQENGINEGTSHENVPHYPETLVPGYDGERKTASGHYGFTAGCWKDNRGDLTTDMAYKSSRSEQTMVARRYARKLWNRHHNWYDAARGWKAGIAGSTNDPDKEHTYGEQVMTKMNRLRSRD